MRILVSWNPDRFDGTKALPQNIRPRTNPATGSVRVLRPYRFKAPVTRRSWRGLTAAALSSMMTRLKFGERAMQRVTITLDDDLMADLDRIIAARGIRTAPWRSATSRARDSKRQRSRWRARAPASPRPKRIRRKNV